jgi:nuclear pore complex protein Nup160
MQIFEQHSMSEGACEFALGALEQIDSIVDLDNGSEAEDIPETTTMIKGRLWANVFKYKLDLKNFQEAYCAIISNPDNDSKYVCLRRFIIVLCELGETKVCSVYLLSSLNALNNLLIYQLFYQMSIDTLRLCS